MKQNRWGWSPGLKIFTTWFSACEYLTSLSPVDLLREIKEFERRMGRDIAHSHYLPRIIDIDILLAGDRAINTEELVVPHQEMTKRAFVLIPLNEIAPGVVHPLLKKPVKEILEQLPVKYKASRVKKIHAPQGGCRR